MNDIFRWIQDDRWNNLCVNGSVIENEEEEDTIIYFDNKNLLGCPTAETVDTDEDDHDDDDERKKTATRVRKRLETQLKHEQDRRHALQEQQEHDSQLIAQLSSKLSALVLENARLRDAASERRSTAKVVVQDNNDDDDDDLLLCVICLEAPRTNALVPCGHFAMCGPCAHQAVVRTPISQTPVCPCCRKEVTSTLRIYHP